ncbi:FAD-dependent oxidoreductase [Methylocella tundrae]|uniref:FAD-dependent oxidoreductase n=1 Tax=Methylocella tundrae TaxID=227605 RepID=UPI0030FEA622|nr:FAD-dependent oxidoreductase [Methylocella tundrae]
MNGNEALRPDLCILGASAAGLALAAAAAAQGLSVVIVGKPMAADHLADIAPGQALRACGDLAATIGRAAHSTVPARPAFQFSRVGAHIAQVKKALEPQYAQARLEAMNVSVLKAPGRFVRPDAVEAGGRIVKARRFVIAAPAQMRAPAIPGLDLIRPVTATDLAQLEAPPERLIVLGGDSQGLAVAQGARRLGAEVAVVAQTRILPGEDAEIVAPLRTQLMREGVVLREASKILRIEPDGARLRVFVTPLATDETEGEIETLEGSHLLLALGASAALEGLGLAAAGVRFDAGGVEVDANLRSSNRRVYAIGAATGDAECEARQILRHILAFPSWFPAGRRRTPRVRAAWTDPQVASTGLSEAEARRRARRIRVLRWPYAATDRAQIEGATGGHVKLVTSAAGRILGAAIVGPGAGELINLYTLSICKGMYASDLASIPLPYPSFSETARAAALAFEARRPPAAWRFLRLLRRST